MAKSIEEQIIDLKNQSYSNQKIAQILLNKNPNLGISWHRLRKKIPKIVEGEITAVESNKEGIYDDLMERKFKAKIKDLDKRYKNLLKKYEHLESKYDELLYVKENEKINSIKPKYKSKEKEEAVAVIQYSDWHVEETVEQEKVNGLNKFNIEIAENRIEKLVNNTLKLINKERNEVKINELVLHLGGDFIGGWIHDELEQMNVMSPIEASIFAKNQLIKAIDFLYNNGNFNRIVCICNRGNHSRTTPKMQHANEMETNYETMIYSGLKDAFRNIDEIEFQIPGSSVGYFDIYNLTIRYFHGQQVRYLDGVGGLAIPLNKKLAKWDETIEADYNLMGHYHNWSFPNKKTTLNGSLKGFDTYAYNNGFSYEPPIQSFQLVDKNRGVTIRCPIFCE